MITIYEMGGLRNWKVWLLSSFLLLSLSASHLISQLEDDKHGVSISHISQHLAKRAPQLYSFEQLKQSRRISKAIDGHLRDGDVVFAIGNSAA
jgi:hypothetical protein